LHAGQSAAVSQSRLPIVATAMPRTVAAVGKAQAYAIPGPTGTTTRATLALQERSAAYHNEVGLFLVDDASGRIGKLKPGDRGYAAAALERRQVLFTRNQKAGAVTHLNLPGGRYFGTYLIQNSTSKVFLARNPLNQFGETPKAFFSFTAANPDRFTHVRVSALNVQAWEDQTRGGDKDFNDAVVKCAFAVQSDTTPPIVTIATPAEGLLARTNTMVTGTVTDDVSGVKALTGSIDGRSAFDVAFDASGNFHFDTTLPINGSAEGRHLISLRATDNAGNVSRPTTVWFMFDTRPPLVTITSPASGLLTKANVTVAGTVSDDVSGVGLLQAWVDTGAPVSVAVDASHHFNFTTALPLTGTADGNHVIHLRATDRAGNVSIPASTGFTLDATAPSTVITKPTGSLTTNTNFTVEGKVTDNLSGVASLTAAVDSEAAVPVGVDPDGAFHFTTDFALDGTTDGLHSVTFYAIDKAGNSASPAALTFTIDTSGLVVVITSPQEGSLHNGDVTVAGLVTDKTSEVSSLAAQLDGGSFFPVAFDQSSGAYSFATQLSSDGTADGTHTVQLRATDKAGRVSHLTGVSFVLDTQPPRVTITSPASGLVTNTNVTVAGTVTDAVSGVGLLQAWVDTGAPASVAVDASSHFSFTTALPLAGSADGDHAVHLQARDNAGNVSGISDVSFQLSTGGTGGFVAPPVDPTVATTIGAATSFLYTGSNPIQTGVAPDAINPIRAAVLRGQVHDRDGQPVPGVTITVLSHPEFGTTTTRADGMLDMAVNGGGYLTVNYAKAGYLSVQRQENVPWQDYAWLPDVVMISQDSEVSPIDLTSGAPIQVARGSPVSDERGARQATLLFTQGTQATMTLPDGSSAPLTTLHVRATEYTVGSDGPQAMPAELPPNSAYTYAVEFNADEATAAGATEVRFSKPLDLYVENFLNFPVGGNVPEGSYDRSRGQWIASDNGQIIQILSITGGRADLDLDGSGQAAGSTALAALGVTDAERQRLAALYQPGQSLWRVPITHFSSWDSNWGWGPPPDAVPPTEPNPTSEHPVSDPDPDCGGSIIQVQNQTLGESIAVDGTPYSLNYESGRAPGHTSERGVSIPLSGSSVPANLKRIDLVIEVAGQLITQSFPAAPNQTTSFTWDGKDAYGRVLQGAQPITVKVGYVYPGVYELVPRFGYNGNGIPIAGNRAARELIFSRTWNDHVANWGSRAEGLGAWTLDVHHTYDPVSRVLYLGDGERRTATAFGDAFATVAGNGGWWYGGDGGPATEASLSDPREIAVGPDGSLYIADLVDNRIRRVGPDGVITTVAGNGTQGFGGDGGPATQASLNYPSGVAVWPDGGLYIEDAGNQRIRRVGPDGVITTVAGNGTQGFGGDGGPATQASLGLVEGLSFSPGIAVGPDGSLYIADTGNSRIRRVGPDGVITTVAGNGTQGFGGDGGPATQASLFSDRSVAIGLDGSLYIADLGRIRRVGPDGVITTVAGGGQPADGLGDGGPATQASLNHPAGIAVGPDGSLYIADVVNQRIRRVGPDGVITTVAGNGTQSFAGDGGPAPQASLNLPDSVAFGPDGSLYVADRLNFRIRKVTPTMPGVQLSDLLIPAEDGRELYVFDSEGRHLRTLDALTGAVLYQFAYDANGHVSQIQDVDGNITTVERDSDGNPTAIIGPTGQRTTLRLDPSGYLASITNPAGETESFGYTDGGLLTSLTDPRNGTHHFDYDTVGRLTRDENPAGGYQKLDRTQQARGFTVTETTAEGKTSNYQVEYLPTGVQERVDTLPCGCQTVTLIGPDGSRTTTEVDGTVTKLTLAPDPRFGMMAPLTGSLTVTTPAGLTSTLTTTRSVTLSNPNDPLSLAKQTDTVTFNGQTFTTTYDAAARTITSRTPEGRTSSITTLDAKGHVTDVQAPGQDPTQFTYYADGRLHTIGQGTRVETLTYDAQGNLASITDPMQQKAQFGSYDAAGRAGSLTLPDGSAIQYTYDANGNIATITPPGRPAHSFTYTPTDLVEKYVPPAVTGSGTNQTQYTYNLDGQLTGVERPDGVTISLGYDTAGRLSTITQPRGTTTLTYASGNVKTITAPDGAVLTYGYDGSLPTDTTWTGTVAGTIHRTYDTSFRLVSDTVGNGPAVTYQYDRDSLLAQAGALTLARDPQNGRLTGSTLGSANDSLNYDSLGEVKQYQAAFGGTSLFSVQYTRDDLGRITQKTETIDGATHTYGYSYDGDGRLTDVKLDGVLTSHYAYDANGNRLSDTVPGGTVTGTYDDQDRLLTYGTASYTYTANGDLKSKTDTATGQTTTYTYDALGNLTAVKLPDGRQIEYLIDGLNRRIGVKVNGTLVQGFLYEGLRLVAELDGSNNVVSRFVYAGRSNVPDYMIRGGVTYRFITDHLGSVRLVVNTATGQVAQRLGYDEFGNALIDTNSGFQPFGFAGGIYDRNTRLVRFGARDYDAETGRWTAKDPIGLRAASPDLYAYAYNDPVNWFDVSGADPTGSNINQPFGPGSAGGPAENETFWGASAPPEILPDGARIPPSLKGGATASGEINGPGQFPPAGSPSAPELIPGRSLKGSHPSQCPIRIRFANSSVARSFLEGVIAGIGASVGVFVDLMLSSTGREATDSSIMPRNDLAPTPIYVFRPIR
jgi:RHS repeat-associated protein